MSGLSGVKRGDTVLVEALRRCAPNDVEPRQVRSVGPKYITVSAGHVLIRFHKDTGGEVTDYTARHFAYASQADLDAKRLRDQLVVKAGRLARDFLPYSATNETLAALIALLEPNA